MRILQINKYFFPFGGSEAIFFDTIKGLRKAGNEVSEFSMQNSKNLPSDYSDYFVSALPDVLSQRQSIANSAKIFKQLFYSSEVKKKLTQLIKDIRPEVAHIHNTYHHLSATLFTTLYKLKIPTVLTLHDYFPVCPNHNLLLGEKGAREILQNKPFNCTRYKCVGNRFAPSLAATLEAYFYRLNKIWQHVDKFICPSNFMKQVMLESGFPNEKLEVVFNAYDSKENAAPLGKSILFLGRIHVEKGIKVFMEACKSLKNYSIIIAGQGPEDRWVEEFIKKNSLTNIKKIPRISGAEWQTVVNDARAVVFPTIAYENCSRGILEALAHKRLVVATDRGGNNEMVQNNKTGFLVKPENVEDLVSGVQKAMELSKENAEVIANNGQKLVKQNYSSKEYFLKLTNIYEDVLKK
jgi:glycosyltransferase involved in cell wall biosynthesis